MVERISGTPGTVGAPQTPALAPTAAQTSPDNPWPLALLSSNMKRYIDKMSAVWIEGQVIEFNRRGKVSYLTLRDLNDEMSLPVQVFNNVLDRMPTQPQEGAHVIVNVKADFWLRAGRLSMRANDIRAVGLGDLLARLERLRGQLRNEGLFAPEHKRRLPFLPSRIGLITGRDSDAQKDVVRNATLRWPAVEFEIRNVAVQGNGAVPQVIAAMQELDADEAVDVIVIARGGGSLEDLLPFSNEAMIRAVYQATTPVVSAIGHEADNPILDEVADLRASTPTDAAKRIVPDYNEEQLGILQMRANLDGALARLLDREAQGLASVLSRPVFAQPSRLIDDRAADMLTWRDRSTRAMSGLVDGARLTIDGLRTQVRSLSPLNTLARGYAVVLDPSGGAVRDAAHVSPGDALSITVARGKISADVTATSLPDPTEPPTAH
ncbi:exodeoxyribonuclease VII large subunit [Brevibacterium sp. 50QC2O2]|jgi:exodeoxyribonuclease VII large subunit|uniref:exodeoxyribonuclease VII large subunit n=1 Tax=Brevibacterium TaxID=1696 RepID=UPI00211BE6C0|nr:MULTISPECIES: exodeoxyribonuclease VII large subunit [unclassified Brevibacterium]MCQ9385899.1 exodeoxyribonuclease VII large subunit [Brevibacterium sp. 68QC2CO]MCQ9387435.1 exodeoxyribonuclease VII large subunit [Brevibacterium sp. 50QC2O2]